MSGSHLTAVVTGANQGLGYGISKRLAEQQYRVVLAGKRGDAAKRAAEQLVQETNNTHVQSAELDIAHDASIASFVESMRHDGGLDVLVNNASIAFPREAFSAQECRETLAVNLDGTVKLTEQLKSLMPRSTGAKGNIVIVSSGGQVSGEAKQMLDSARSGADLIQLGQHFVRSIEDGSFQRRGFPRAMMSVSKLLENRYAQLLADELRQKTISVCAVHPGSVRSKMSNFKGAQSPYDAAEAPAHLACHPLPSSKSGAYFMGLQQAG